MLFTEELRQTEEFACPLGGYTPQIVSEDVIQNKRINNQEDAGDLTQKVFNKRRKASPKRPTLLYPK